ncbi:MAG: VRR-NUC domain-containing protein [Pontibacterium sp.]
MKRTSLENQCKALTLPFEEIQLDYEGKPEPALLKYYENLGYIGSFIEGYTLLTVLKALMLEKLVALNDFNDRNDACTRYLEAQLTIHKDKTSEIISAIKATSKKKYLSNLKEIFSQPFIQSEYPNLSFECCVALFDAIDKDILVEVAAKFAEDPYKYRSGWPDLIIVKGKEVRFIEVKTTDKLHKSQLRTIPIFRQILPYDFSVCRVYR